MACEPLTERLAGWTTGTAYEDLPDVVRSKALDVVYDSIGGMVACAELPEVAAIVGLIEEQGGRPECSVIGRSERTSVVSAAMAHGAMAHGDEVDPVHTTSVGGHVAAGPVPAALAVGERVDASGPEVLRAVALGYEVGGRLMTILYRERDYVSRRFYHTAVVANVTSAVSAGVLLGLDAAALRVAMCLAAYQAAGIDNMTKDPGHMGKTLQVAAAARNGVTAALLAARGAVAPLDVLEGPNGLFDAYLGSADAGAGLLDGLGTYYAIGDVMHKRYSAGTPNQTYVHGLLRLLRTQRIGPDEIAGIEIHMPQRSVHRLPATRHASISAVKVCAIAAATGRLDFSFVHGPAAAVDAVIASMAGRIRFVGRDDWTGMEQGRHAIVIVRTVAGRTFEDEVWHEPMSRAELEDKFEGLVGPKLGRERTARLNASLAGLGSAAGIRPLMEQLAD